ncbi:hypothetical protein UFOVP205_13 [uncultured Caudovirales phage]|jgi:hypothetical protein|uniref:Uncharacterized protein n=1 Tax=uncultured Caudovirales phage TaxID=2100421 RepID=A0A6J7WNM4_9CAUD|nr:hypothetical protein UFOVP267_41 [uncultured Caudovirales phage]CAB5217714.1 hypothetical protein UFOVP205_13 [uncultured Caudovirales phage]
MASCADCRFFLNAQIMGSCRRYPQTINRHMNDWCGEHSAPTEPEMVNLPVYDILTDTVAEPKKRGRKPKNDQAIA